MPGKIAIAQTNTNNGAINENKLHLEKFIIEAINNNVNTIIFPQNAILGINLKDLQCNKLLIAKKEQIEKELKEKYSNINIIFDNEKCDGINIFNLPQKYQYNNIKNYIEKIKNRAGLNVFVNAVGCYDEKIYEGRSFAVKDGKIISISKFLEEDLTIIDENSEIQYDEKSFEEEIFKVLSFGLKDYCKKIGFKKIVLGLSGGLDSAISAVIACNAIGSENVLGITMPSKYSSKGSCDDSFELAKNLGMTCIEKSIKPLFDEFINSIQDGKQYNDLSEENIQPRIRALILMNYSNRENRLLLSTGNKSECSMGYCTLYGDTCGGLNLIADVFKTDLYKISYWVNKYFNKEIIPNNILTKAPSAELRPDQKDEDSLPPYEILDDILRRYIEEQQTIDEIAKDYDKNFVIEIIKKLNFNEFKRHQGTLFFEISKKSLGFDRCFPIMQKLDL